MLINQIVRNIIRTNIKPICSKGLLNVREFQSALLSHRFVSSIGLRRSMEEHQVLPDVIDVLPPNVIEVRYSSGVEAKLGNELTPTQVKDIPVSIKWPNEETALYTLCLTDPDAPSRQSPKYREWHHWLVVNIPGNNVSRGDTLSEYVGSGPPKGTGLHRYVFSRLQTTK